MPSCRLRGTTRGWRALGRVTAVALATIAGAPAVAPAAGSQGIVCTAPPPAACVVTASQAFAGDVDLGGRDLDVAAGVVLTATAPSTVTAGNVVLEPGARLVGTGNGASGVDLVVTATSLWVQSGIAAAVIGTSGVDAGDLTITATGLVRIDGELDAHAGKDGLGGAVTITTDGDVVLNGTVDGSSGLLTDTLTVTAGGSIAVGGVLDFSGDGGGGSVDLEAVGSLTTAPPSTLDVDATAAGNDGGDVTLRGASILLAGKITGRASGSTIELSGTGASVDVASPGDVALTGPIDLTGPAPDGSGGSLAVQGRGVTLSGSVQVPGKGTDGLGGFVQVVALGALTTGLIDASGGSQDAGDVDLYSHDVMNVAVEVNGDAASGGSGATLVFRAAKITVGARVHANGIRGRGTGGTVSLHACDLSVAATGSVTTLGEAGRNVLESNGPIVVNGPVIAGGKTCTAGADDGMQCATPFDCTPPADPTKIPPSGLCSNLGVSDVIYADPASVPVLNGNLSPLPVPPGGFLKPDLGPCIDPLPPPTTTSTSSTTSSTTSTSHTTTSSTRSTTSTSSSSTSTSSSTSSVTSSTEPGATTTTSSSATSSTAVTTSTSSSTSTSSTSSTTTSSATVTSTTTSSTAPTSTATSTTSTSTSTSLPACSPDAPLACDDGDPCTDDVCVDGACANPPVDGVRAVTCRLDVLAGDVRTATAADVGGAAAQKRLLGKIAAVQRTVGAAGAPGTARARRRFKRAGRQLQSFIATVTRARTGHKIVVPLGDRLLATAGEAKGRILPLER